MQSKLVMQRYTFVLLLLVLNQFAAACMWDRDTLGDEARNHGNIVDVLTGRFPRNPPLYYEMRLERVSREVVAAPENLELYDDGGVACDRLNRGEEAIEWMARKRVQLEKAEESAATREHWYRYHANLGTFQAHQWFRDGAFTTTTALLEKGADNIAKAIEINPDAHFGREQYQLDLMRWLISKPEPFNYKKITSGLPSTFLDNLLNANSEKDPAYDNKLEKASAGLVGLIYLGNAWESIDVFYVLAQIHGKLRNASIRDLCMARVSELLDEGKKPVLASLMSSGQIDDYNLLRVYSGGQPEFTVPVQKLRKNADKWQSHRTAYLMEGLGNGNHPDTDKAFWDDYVEVPKVWLLKGTVPGTAIKWTAVKTYLLEIIIVSTGVLYVLLRLYLARRTRKKMVPETGLEPAQPCDR